MNPAIAAEQMPDKPAYIMADSGQVVTFKELNDTSMQGSQLLRSLGLKHGDHIAIMLENHPRFFQLAWAAQRSGLYYTCISYRLQEEEVEYIVNDCDARVFITSKAQTLVAEKLVGHIPKVEKCYMLDGEIAGFDSWEDAIGEMPCEPVADETEGVTMLYSSGTTGRPKGIKRDLPVVPFGSQEAPNMFAMLYGATDDSIYLSPAPLYHSAPMAFNMSFLRSGNTCVVMEHFEEEKALRYIEKYKITHSQWVPTMFIRMLKLPKETRLKYDMSSMQAAIHAAAPCPVQIKEIMIDWWGPVIHEYYAGTEGNGFVAINSEQWLSHKGSVGQALTAKIHICDEAGEDVPTGESGVIYFEGGGEFEYYKDKDKTADSRHPKGWSTLGDIGYLDEEGFLYLTDRKSFMIISGGVNIYPQEVENLLVTHHRVMDVAVFGVPNAEFGEEVKAVVQPIDFGEAGAELADELIGFCREHLSHVKCPRSVDFLEELPRHPTGKLYKRLLRDKYWEGHKTHLL